LDRSDFSLSRCPKIRSRRSCARRPATRQVGTKGWPFPIEQRDAPLSDLNEPPHPNYDQFAELDAHNSLGTWGGGIPSHPAAYYRWQAARARQAAEGVTTRAMKARLLDEAIHYDRLAADAYRAAEDVTGFETRDPAGSPAETGPTSRQSCRKSRTKVKASRFPGQRHGSLLTQRWRETDAVAGSADTSLSVIDAAPCQRTEQGSTVKDKRGSARNRDHLAGTVSSNPYSLQTEIM
jgi:hypothetical protein